ncbi:AT-rich interactive domain-containing protein 2 [Dendrobium catenatum]|uniref:AT-rich interactive domain-containing protein 2 n=1 Tax=Dendrobium catenatum TaxID=906689 RepID=A0A2I0VWY5_9ASPA|nr:AT-rich interactive domain-containing protein 2 [Dendrobium catenatum]PKU67909.1 AT-rich interactive domain-containing protein 2 [Dendrobium catenatum]
MEGWLVPDDECSSSDVCHILRKLQCIGFCSAVDPIVDDSRFEQILSVFLKELHCKREIRPFPAMLGEGRPIDLYKLYLLVSERGGYNSVTANKSWAGVAEGIGLDSALGCPLKLIYAKYLNMLERCLQMVPANRPGIGGYSGSEENLGVLMSDPEPEVRSLFKEILKRKREDGINLTLSPCSKMDQFLTRARQKEPMLLLDNAKCVRPSRSTALSPKLANGSFSSLKRKRESLIGMLNWVKTVAKNPIDPSTVKILPSDGPKDMKNLVGLHYSLAFQVRKVLFLKNIHREDINTSTSQKGQKIHSFMYEDCNGAGNTSFQTLRCTKGTFSSDKPSHSGSCSKASTVCMGEKDDGHINNANEANNCRRKLRSFALLPDYLADCELNRIPVGSSFQVQVPPWTRKPANLYDSDDLKWLGRRIWPPEDHEKKLPSPPTNLIGKGREDSCKCRNPGSVQCVRFHVAEKRLQLKCELGVAFYAWRFHFMGEEVALSWKEEEERRFKAIFRLNQPPHSQNFWKQLHLCFPRKGNRNLVSYYFNVFLLALRSYQNRVSPNNIDSDDEETEVGFLNCSFGYGSIRFHDPKSIVCAQNLQCVDLAD